MRGGAGLLAGTSRRLFRAGSPYDSSPERPNLQHMAVENVQAQGIARAYLASADVARANGANARSASAAAPQRPGRVGDELALSDEARSLVAARQEVTGSPDVREAKVAAIRQRIQDGTYVVSSELLARGMLRYAQQQG